MWGGCPACYTIGRGHPASPADGRMQRAALPATSGRYGAALEGHLSTCDALLDTVKQVGAVSQPLVLQAALRLAAECAARWLCWTQFCRCMLVLQWASVRGMWRLAGRRAAVVCTRFIAIPASLSRPPC